MSGWQSCNVFAAAIATAGAIRTHTVRKNNQLIRRRRERKPTISRGSS
jgi:hypothetical protein